MSTVMDQSNRTFIGSVVFVDIVGYTKKSVSDQIVMKDRFTSLLSDSLKDIAADQRIILDTGDGAALSFIGDPEDALFVGMNMRDMLKDLTPGAAEPNDESTSSSSDLYLRIGINLGPIKLIRDINGQPNIVGDGINVAQRIMSFARPGQVVVSRSYFDVVSVISDEYVQLFKYEGSRTDKHVREHEIYVVGDSAAAFNKAKSGMEDRAAATNPRNKVAPQNLATEASKKTAKPSKSGTTTTERNNERTTADAPDSSASSSRPLLQDKKKLGAIGAVLAAIVLVLGIMVVIKKPASPDNTKTDDTAAALALATSPNAPATTLATTVAPALTPPTTPATGLPNPSNPSGLASTSSTATNAATASITPTTTSPVVSSNATPSAANNPAPISSATRGAPSATTKSDPLKNDPTKPDATKVASGQGSISFAIAPWGEILINNRSIGLSPPLKQHKLAPGKYKIEVRNADLTPFITNVEVKAKEELTVRYQFK